MLLAKAFMLVIFCSLFSCSAQAPKKHYKLKCDPGFKYAKPYCFKFLSGPLTRYEAGATCYKMEASLFDVRTWQDERTLENFVEEQGLTVGHVWLVGTIGASRRVVAGFRVNWPDTGHNRFRLDNFRNRSSIQKERGSCLVATFNKRHKYWQRYPCRQRAHGLCVKSASTYSTNSVWYSEDYGTW